MAQLIATQKVPQIISTFDFARFAEGRLVGEKGAAAVGH
jgi:sarcosine oxidase subunit beta